MSRTLVRTLSAALLALAVLARAGSVAAQGAAEKAAADALFDEGRNLMAAGRYTEACHKLVESQELAPGTGTLLNLGECYEKLGRTASAWTTFRSAAASALAKRQVEREELARSRAAGLEAKLSRLTILVPDEVRTAGLRVTRDGADVPQALWGQAVPVDPGTIQISVSAPGKRTRSQQVAVGAGPLAMSYAVEPLEAESEASNADVVTHSSDSAPAQKTATSSAASRTMFVRADRTDATGSTLRLLGWSLVGLGGAGLAVSTGYFLKARSKDSESDDYCGPAVGLSENQCRPGSPGVALREEAQDAETVSLVFAIAGVGAVGAGVVLLATAPSTHPTSRGARLVAGATFRPDRGALLLSGEW